MVSLCLCVTPPVCTSVHYLCVTPVCTSCVSVCVCLLCAPMYPPLSKCEPPICESPLKYANTKMYITNASIGQIRMSKRIQTIHLLTGHFMPSQKLTTRVCKARECTLKMSTTDVFKVCSEVKATCVHNHKLKRSVQSVFKSQSKVWSQVQAETKCGHKHKLKQSVQSVVTGRSTSVVTSDSSHNDEPHPPHIGVSALFLLISSIFCIHSPALLITRIDRQCRTVLLSIISYKDCTRIVPGF